ncbi:GSCFA family protein [Maribacter vaceletii]|uniref:GSCFA family protein n=1 Tax=Maribacter vaceletii TaxID=1206816 RepID=A0A495EF13_9FLAO|nr:GSCFA domain-containing protein [Maribacter vaceletii]RKR15356.1 GSCFA family protein [Maribacter vaceletii]
MKLQTKIPLQKEKNQINYSSKLLLLGSCFVENIGEKLKYYKFQTVQNPFGILFHPLAIENLVSRAIALKEYTKESIFLNEERWHCYDAHSELSSNTPEELLEKLNSGLRTTKEQIKEASHIVITLGTAWVYSFIEEKKVVANCHKVPQKQFSKKILSVNEIQDSLEHIKYQIKKINKEATLIFTVSPVRHIKDGFVENQQSKAHLITAIHEVIKKSNVTYFPSYEIMMDELRDYRFYKEDMVHPNATAVNYIWEKFTLSWINEEAQKVMDKVSVVQKGLAHRPFNEKSLKHKEFLKALEKKKTYLQEAYSFMKFTL